MVCWFWKMIWPIISLVQVAVKAHGNSNFVLTRSSIGLIYSIEFWAFWNIVWSGDLVIFVRAEEDSVVSPTFGATPQTTSNLAPVAEVNLGFAKELSSSYQLPFLDQSLRSNRTRVRRRATGHRPTSLALSQQDAWPWPMANTLCGPRDT